MLETKTIQKVNRLIQCLADHCINSLESEKIIRHKDIRALSNLINSISVQDEPSSDNSPVVGFMLPTSEEENGDIE